MTGPGSPILPGPVRSRVMAARRRATAPRNRGIPVMFRSVEDGMPIDFVLQNARAEAGAASVATGSRFCGSHRGVRTRARRPCVHGRGRTRSGSSNGR